MAMLNALVCALAGFPGEIFGGQGEDSTATWTQKYRPQNPENCPLGIKDDGQKAWHTLLAHGEKVVINELVQMGYHYRELTRFATVESQADILSMTTSSEPTVSGRSERGAYRRAFAFGLIDSLKHYRAEVLSLEKDLRDEDKIVPLTSIQSTFCDYAIILPKLHQLICTVYEQNIRGCSLISFLEEAAVCGIPPLESALKVILQHCYEVFFKQLAAWVVYGRLIDRDIEFFIQSANIDNKSAFDVNYGNQSEADSTKEWHDGFTIAADEVPKNVTTSIAETILFIGKAQRILNYAKKDITVSSSMREENPVRMTSLKILQRLEELQRQTEFPKVAFELLMHDLRKDVAAQLWQLVVTRAQLPRHLQALKDYFLMDRGNFHHLFLSDARSLMKMPPRASSANFELVSLFQQAAQRTGAEEDPLFKHVSIFFRSKAEEESGSSLPKVHLPSCDEWDKMCMGYEVSWPLGIILTPDVLSQYHTMFQFLWRVQRIHVELDEVWSTLRTLAVKSHSHALLTNSPLVWHLRHQMVHLISNLQIYVQVDVIEAQHSKLQKHMSSAENFLDLQGALNVFLTSLITQSFLDIASISSMLDSILKLCFQFCNAVHGQLDNDNPLNSLPLFTRLRDDFIRRCNMLFTVLKSTKLSVTNRAPHLHQFLLRLNFNDYIGKLVLQSTTTL